MHGGRGRLAGLVICEPVSAGSTATKGVAATLATPFSYIAVSATAACAKEDLPFTKHPKLVELTEKNGLQKCSMLFSENACSSFINCRTYCVRNAEETDFVLEIQWHSFLSTCGDSCRPTRFGEC